MQLFNKPVIKYFRAERLEVIADEPLLLEWETEDARTVTLDGVKVDQNSSYFIRTNQSRTIELIAHNRMGGTATEYIFIQLLTPTIIRLETEETTIKENEPTEVNFDLRNCLSWKLIMNYGTIESKERETLAKGKIENPREPFCHAISAQLKGSGELVLQAKNGSETHSGYIRLYQRHTEVSLSTNQTVVIQGSEVRITWQAKHANKIILNPGNIDVTTLNHFDLKVDGETDVQLEIKAFGDFGQQVSDSKTLYLAKFNKVYTSNNGDPAKSLFYLNWSGTGFRSVMLLPDGVPVQENEINYLIPPSTEPAPYVLVGKTHSEQEVSKLFVLNPCTIQRPQLEKGMVIVGMMATLTWKANHATKIQLTFSDSPIPIEIPVTENKYDFQVSKNRNKVKLTAWGDVNVVESEILIQAFQSPQIGSLFIPKIDLRLGVRWLPPPPVRSGTKTFQLLSLLNNKKLRQDHFYGQGLKYLSYASDWLLKKQNTISNPVKRTSYSKVNGLSKKLASLVWVVVAKLAKAHTTKMNTDEQKNFL